MRLPDKQKDLLTVLIILIGLGLILCSKSDAAAVTIEPDGVGTNDQWTQNGGSSKADAVSDDEADCAVSYTSISTTTVGHLQDFTLGNPSIAADATINSVTFTFQADRVGAASTPQMRIIAVLSGNTTNGTARTIGTSNCTEWSESLTRPGGGSWTVSDLNDLQVRMQYISTLSGTPTMHCIKISVTIDYTPAASETGLRRKKLLMMSNE